ncbi:MAG: acyltransferase family protein, partial [Acidobacteriota bacterium]
TLSRWREINDWLAQRLSRVTSSVSLIPEVDGLRFLAIAAVVFHHLVSIYLPATGRVEKIASAADWFAAAGDSWLIKAAYCGHFGVNLFFVISGFILAIPFVKRAFLNQPAPELKSYYLRRVTRIEPPYLICLIVYLLIKWQDGNDITGLLPNFLASALYLHGPLYERESAINGVAWSLEIEIQFYLIVPLLMRGFNLRDARFRRYSLLAAIILFGLLSQLYIYPHGPKWLMISLPNFMHYFLAGFLLADLYQGQLGRERERSWRGDLLALAAGAAILWILLGFGHLYFLLPLLIAALYLGCYLGRMTSRLIRMQWIVIIGGMCYTIYLYHVMIISQAFVRTASLSSMGRAFQLDLLAQSLIICPLILIISALLFVATEKPFMKLSLSGRGRRERP